MCPLRFDVPPQVPCACVYVQERVSSRPTCMCTRLCSCPLPPPPLCLSAALMTLAQRKVMTNARYQRTRPMTNGWAPEQPHYAVITEDGWPGAPPHHPYPSAPVTGSGSARPGGSRAARLAANHRGAEKPRPWSQEPTRPPAAEEQSGALGGSRRRTGSPARLRPGHAAVHTHGRRTRLPPVSLHRAPAAPVQAQPPPHGSTDTCFHTVHGHTSAPRSRYTPTHINPCTHGSSCTRLQKPLMFVHMNVASMSARGWIRKYAHT